ncbi:hypothetical protein Q9233_001875 [Columba guinea]|nr:hypothetical protein Q9233_001875 [Columba guinea]
MKIIRDTQQAETSKKKQEFENLNVKLLDLQPLISRNSATKEDLHNAKGLNKKLRLENEAARQKYEQLLEEERDWAIERDEVVAK